MLNKAVWSVLRSKLVTIFSNGEGIRLSEEVGHQLLMICDNFISKVDVGLRLGESNELRRDDSALMHQLVEAVLAIGPWFTKDDWTCLDAWSISHSSLGHAFSITFHIQLLDMSGESNEGLAIRQDCS